MSAHTLVLIDGHALAFRSYYGISRPLINSKGQSTKAIVGFMRVLLRHLKRADTQVIVTFDPPAATFRHERYPQYKAGRAETPPDLPPQIDALRDLIDALGLVRLERVGYEADDVIGSVSTRASQAGLAVHIISSDRDTYQLLGLGNVHIVASDGSLIGPPEVQERYGVQVEQWLDFRALTGDSSDNIPGARGIGEKTAAKILQQYPNLEEAYRAAKEGLLKPDGVRKKLLDSEENVWLSRELSEMCCDLELDFELGRTLNSTLSLTEQNGDPERLNALLTEFELESIRKELAKLLTFEDTEHAENTDKADNTTDDNTADDDTTSLPPLQVFPAGTWQLPTSSKSAKVVWGYHLSREDDLQAHLLAAAYVEPKQDDPKQNEPAQIRIAPLDIPASWATWNPQGNIQPNLFGLEQTDHTDQANTTDTIPLNTTPLNKTQQKQLDKAKRDAEKAFAKLRAEQPATVNADIFANTPQLHAAHAKALAKYLLMQQQNVEPADDPLLMAYLLDPNNVDMATCSKRYLGCEWPEISEMSAETAMQHAQNQATRQATQHEPVQSEPVQSEPVQSEQVQQRAAITHQLLELLPSKMEQHNPKALELYHQMEKPLAGVLARMEVRGICLDSAYLRGLSSSLSKQIEHLETRIQDLAGHAFSVRSRNQLETVLYDELGLESGKKTKQTKRRSTAVSALEPLREAHPIVPMLLEFRELEKLRSTYLDPLPDSINPHTGRLHTTFLQTAVATGRLSSVNPNLQNIPIRSEIGREIRKGFISSEGFLLISADYSQIELRLLAHIANDERMQQAFTDGADIHKRTAAQIFGVAEDDVAAEQRRVAKTINFGVLYGMSAHRLSKELGISYKDAQDFIQTYFSTYPKVEDYIEQTLEFGRNHGYVQTLYGRRRYVPELLSNNRIMREAGERLAYNMPIQGSAADIIKMAMIELEKRLEPMGAHLLLQIHDELIIEAPHDKAQEVAEITQKVMQNAAELSVPLAVDYGIGEHWYDTH